MAPSHGADQRHGGKDQSGCGGHGARWHALSDFCNLEEIAVGRASKVWSAYCKTTKMHVAIKAYKKSKLSASSMSQVQREISILDESASRHPFICPVLASFEDQEDVYLVQEFCDRGDVLGLLEDGGGRLSEDVAVCQVLWALLQALRHVHAQGIVHRDIKPENLFVTANGTVKLGDFGLAINMKHERLIQRIGTLDYMAPEVLMLPVDNDEDPKHVLTPYNQQVDAWAVGILAYELLVGKPPFEVADESVTCAMIIWSELPTHRSGWPAHLSDNAISFIQQALVKAPEARLSVEGMLQHPWVMEHAAGIQSFTAAAQACSLISAVSIN